MTVRERAAIAAAKKGSMEPGVDPAFHVFYNTIFQLGYITGANQQMDLDKEVAQNYLSPNLGKEITPANINEICKLIKMNR